MESTPTPRSSVSPPKANDKAPKILDLPIGLDATGMRREFDSLGDVQVPANRYWGAQTQRSLQHFNIGNDRMPKEVYHASTLSEIAVAVGYESESAFGKAFRRIMGVSPGKYRQQYLSERP
jgi:AraC-like DNA-binding protein